MEEQEQEQT
jgi:hypothetical protein